MASGQGRLVSIDFWRGFALVTIFVNHVPGHIFSYYTFRNFGLSDAAELFVLLAGVSAAFAYLRPMRQGDTLRTCARVGMRAFQLYSAHLALVVVAVMVVGGFVILTRDTRILELYHLDIISLWPVETFVGLGLLTYQPAYLNILPLYVCLLMMAPALLLLARIRPLLALGASAAVYVGAELLPLAPPVWPGPGGWYFNPFAWQLLFTCGLMIGIAVEQGARLPMRQVLDVLAPAYLLAACAWALAGFHPVLDLSPLPRFLWALDKTNLGLPRLLHILALAYCVSRLPVESWLKARPSLSGPFALMGRHSLPVFCVGTVLSLAAQVTRPSFDGALAYDLLVFFIGFSVLWLMAWALEWYGRGQRAGGRSGAPPRTDAAAA